jgi:hypothetical protein
MCLVAGDCRDGECGNEGVGCNPPEAVRAFHAKEILFSSFFEASHLRRVKHCEESSGGSTYKLTFSGWLWEGKKRRASDSARESFE